MRKNKFMRHALAFVHLGAMACLASALACQNAYAAGSEIDNILNAVRNWSIAQGDHSTEELITHSIIDDGLKPGESLLPTTGHDGILRGEDARARWPIFLTAKDLTSDISVRIVYSNAATVLAEASRLHLVVNGRMIATEILRYPDKPGVIEMTLPAALLRAGENELQLRAVQHHRIDCSLDGVYELWTAIDLERSVLSVKAEQPRFGTLADLSAIARGPGQRVMINLLLPSDRSPSSAEQENLLQLAQKAVLAAKAQTPAIRTLSQQDDYFLEGPAIDLFVGSLADLMANQEIRRLYAIKDASNLLARQKQSVALIEQSSGGRVLLAKLNELAHLPDAFAFLKNAPAIGRADIENGTVSLQELGFEEREFQGRRLSETVDLHLPADFYAADYASLDFHLFGSYANDITSGQLELRINGKRSIAIPLRKDDAGVIRDRLVKIPLSELVPGANHIEIAGLLERQGEDGLCATRLKRVREASFFLSGESYFRVPKLARLPVLPNVNTTLRTGYPYRQVDGQGAVALEIHDEASKGLKVAAEFLARMAVNSGAWIDVDLHEKSLLQKKIPANRIVVGSYATIPSRLAHFQQGVDLTGLATASQTAYLAAQDADLMSTASIGSTAGISATPMQALPPAVSQYDGNASFQPMPPMISQSDDALADQYLRESFRKKALKERDGFRLTGLTTSVKNALSPIANALAQVTSPSAEQSALDHASKALISQKWAAGEVTTLVSYDGFSADYLDLSPLFRSSTQSRTPHHTIGMAGYQDRIVQLSSGTPWIGNLPLTQAKNWKLVFAGWLSNNPLVYAIATILSLLAFGFVSSMLLNRTKRSRGRDFEQAY